MSGALTLLMRPKRVDGRIGLAAGPKQSFADVYDAHVDEVYLYVHRRCLDHALAEDITQETFIAAVRSTDDPSSITVPWLITVARNRLFDVLRRQVNYDKKLRLISNASRNDAETDITERLRIESALKALPVRYRLALSLHYLNGMTVRAIAKELDQSEKAIESLMTRARKAMRAELERSREPFRAEGAS